jgi:hypothetical protein
MRKLVLLASVLALSACAGTSTQTPWQQDVAAVQMAWPIAQVGLNLALAESHASAAVVAGVTKAETQLSAEIAALPQVQQPTSAALVLVDAKLLVNSLPPGTLSPTHEAEVQGVLAALTLLANYTSG